jgi:hypothetical protein
MSESGVITAGGAVPNKSACIAEHWGNDEKQKAIFRERERERDTWKIRELEERVGARELPQVPLGEHRLSSN